MKALNIKTAFSIGIIGSTVIPSFAVDNNNNITISHKSLLNEIKTKMPEQKNNNMFIISHDKLLDLMEQNFFSKESARKINKFLFSISVDLANRGYIRKAQMIGN
ncbi:hypothetical protein FACS189459_1490 [Bacilli bacterium]|nr:hypothetical protein FACS189459_1490 [Bacilli bacterium]